jgi:thioredoxin-related protein
MRTILSVILFSLLLGTTLAQAQLLNNQSNSAGDKKVSVHEQIQSTIDSGFEWIGLELIFGYAEWCTYCLKMRKESLPDSSVVDAINRYFIPVQLDGESPDPVVFNGTQYTKNQLARGLQLSSFPTHYFVDAEGGVLGAQPGFIEPDIYALLLRYVGSNAFERISFDEYVELNM